VTFTTAGWPTAAIQELAISAKIMLVPIDEPKIKDLTKKYPFYSRIIIPKGTYKDQEKDVATITTMAQWVVGAEVPDEVVYKLTKALWESGAAKMANAHAQGKNVQIKTALAGMAVPLHPGAEKYYKEVGVIKAEPPRRRLRRRSRPGEFPDGGKPGTPSGGARFLYEKDSLDPGCRSPSCLAAGFIPLHVSKCGSPAGREDRFAQEGSTGRLLHAVLVHSWKNPRLRIISALTTTTGLFYIRRNSAP